MFEPSLNRHDPGLPSTVAQSSSTSQNCEQYPPAHLWSHIVASHQSPSLQWAFTSQAAPIPPGTTGPSLELDDEVVEEVVEEPDGSSLP